jgi:putative radical SAM enzyme (TIGR03279 family)
MLKITKVKRNSIAKELGLEIGDEIIAFDGYPCEDELDYLYYVETDGFTMTVRDKRGKGETTVEVEKDEGEDLGLEFEKHTSIRTCHNRCVFCFVDQMPKGMRESLYVKDDDYNMSFSCGNFVTLTNLTDEGLDRIIRLRLSPLYVSVHTMNPDLRVKLLRNRNAGKIVEQIDKLAKADIELHCQAVLVPNENDGEELIYTVRELFKYYPAVRDVACVPTGITKYREGLYPIPDVDKAYSEKLLDTVDTLNKEFGVNFLLPADEYFIKAERPFKDAEFYGDFEQIENGIGMTSKFLQEANEAINEIINQNGQGRYALKTKKRSVIISGVSAEKTLQALADKCNNSVDGLHAEVLAIKNDFFGHTVTCTGLLTGADILRALQKLRTDTGAYDEVLLAGNTMREFEDVFLCGMTLDELKEKLGFTNIKVNKDGGYGLIELLTESK